jgi:hypothetical protein
MGYLPAALRNYLLRLGWGHGDDEIISTQQAIEWFDLGGIGRSPSRFDFAKLDNLNGHYMRQADDAELAKGVAEKLGKAGDAAALSLLTPHVLDLEVVLDAVLGAFAAEAGFLHAAEGRHLGRDDAGVDADHAVFQRLGHAPDAAHVAGVEVGGEAELGVVGHADRLGLVLEAEQRRHRAEGFLARHAHVGVTSARMVGSKKCRRARGACRRDARLAPLADGVGDVLLDLGHRLHVDQRAPGDAGFQAVADLQRGDAAASFSAKAS